MGSETMGAIEQGAPVAAVGEIPALPPASRLIFS
jgi:hypothetical protein